MPGTVRLEHLELEKKFKKRWPTLYFFDASGDLNGYGVLAKQFLDLEKHVLEDAKVSIRSFRYPP